MCQILCRLKNNTHADPAKDAACYKTGMPVVVMSDGHQWRLDERPPGFFVVSLPGISVDRAMKYLAEHTVQNGTDEDGNPIYRMARRRIWRFRVEDMPAAARNKINAGLITIGPGGDYTWNQVRNYLRNLNTGLDETEAL